MPHIETNKVFYLRQLWLYNEGFNHTSTNTEYMFAWTENVAKRGSIDVGSCLLRFVRNVANDWPELVLWSDSCGSQNRNLNMVALIIALVNSNNRIKKITHRFLWSGHSHLPNDSDFSHTEKKKSTAGIFSPEKYVKIMKNARRKNIFHVTCMKRNDFLDIKIMKKSIANKRKDDCGKGFKFTNIHEMFFEEGFVGFHFRYNFDDEAVCRVDLSK